MEQLADVTATMTETEARQLPHGDSQARYRMRRSVYKCISYRQSYEDSDSQRTQGLVETVY